MSTLYFIGSILILFFLSRKTLNELYFLLKKILKKNSIIYLAISIIFFPGTLLHELSHAIMARLLLLKVTEIKLIPEWKNNSIQLGRVTYVKGDFIRSIIIGVAPIFGGIALLFAVAITHLFPNANIYFNILLIYIIFVISSTMFSSKQDLVDIGYMIPVVIAIGAILFFFKINVFSYLLPFAKTKSALVANEILETLNGMMSITIALHVVIILSLKGIRTLIS